MKIPSVRSTKNTPAQVIIDHAAHRRKLERLSYLMDSSIPLPGGYRIGWDGIIGLIPGIGDLAGLGISLYIIAMARRLEASNSTLLRMLGNVALETVVGAIPIIGDLFDFGFKANVRNMRLLDSHLVDAAGTRHESHWRLALVVLALTMITVALFYVAFKVLSTVLGWIF